MNGEKVIAIAKREIGVTEVPFNTNKTKYGQWFGLDSVFRDDFPTNIGSTIALTIS